MIKKTNIICIVFIQFLFYWIRNLAKGVNNELNNPLRLDEDFSFNKLKDFRCR